MSAPVTYNTDKIREQYAQTYASFKALPGYAKEHKFLKYRFAKVLAAGKLTPASQSSCLDLGCGLGIKTRIISEFFGQTAGADFVERCVQIASLLNDNPGLRFFQSDVTNPSQEQFDFVTAFGLSVFNVHDEKESAAAIAKAMKQYVKPGGAMIIYSFTDFSGKAPSGWVNHTKTQLAAVQASLKAEGLETVLYFPHRHADNYFGNGFYQLVSELGKWISRGRRDYYLIVRYQHS